ncbi:hypothetical protein E1B28_002088 [Marasmius oreades]|uniref:Uncharacterized protein n=1 Tax=Marasmius oreades TaxID=181124 RepID=A0A9P7RM12_9AGAR|nr:uncharacterized protein E1B28_002088 [Marasmius oreades]KAG7086129.1 hypothetical protein E1B28_002088 [Marasmius oreades]
MDLKEGNYFISYHDTSGHVFPIARRLNDDSTCPQAPVVKYAEPIPPELATWKLEGPFTPNTYFLYNGNKEKPADYIDKFVWLKKGDPQVWRIEPASTPGTYIILWDADDEFGWVVPDGSGDEAQIECREDAEPSVFSFVPVPPQECS